jgi:hypothetical protein
MLREYPLCDAAERYFGVESSPNTVLNRTPGSRTWRYAASVGGRRRLALR